MARHVLLCAFVFIQLLCGGQCSRGVRNILRDPNQELQTHAGLSNAADRIIRSSMVRKDSLGAKSASERFLEAVQHSHRRMSLRQRKVRLATDFGGDAVTVPVSFGSAVFVMPVSLGTPPQQFTVEVDTGSQLCWIQCAPCKSCFEQPHAFFNPMASSSYSEASCDDPLCQEVNTHQTPQSIRQVLLLEQVQKLSPSHTCHYFYDYLDSSSTRGVLSSETLTLPDSSPHFRFGCGHTNNGNFEAEDGLFRLSQGALSLPSQLGVAKVFSYCLVTQFSGEVRSSALTFGDAEENAHVAYSPMVLNPNGDYHIDVIGVTVGGELLQIPVSVFEFRDGDGGGVILDSGTTLSYWIQDAFDAIVAAFRQQIAFDEVDAHPYDLNLCYDVSGIEAPTFPDLVVHMADAVDHEIPAGSLFLDVTDDASSVMCLSMVPADDASTVGNIAQKNQLVVYDIVNQRIGFQKMEC